MNAEKEWKNCKKCEYGGPVWRGDSGTQTTWGGAGGMRRGVVRRGAEGNKEIPDKETDRKIKQSLPLLLPRPNVTLLLKAAGC